MDGGREDPLRLALLDLLAAIHHEHAVGHLGNHAHVVRDEDHAHVHLVLQAADQLQDLRLDRHVERGGRFVGDQQCGPARQRHRDHHALPHPARQLVRIAREHAARLRNPHEIEQPQRLGARVGRGLRLVQRDRLADLVADREHRVERRHRFLEDHRDIRAAHAAHRRGARLREVELRAVAPPQRDPAAREHAAAVLDEPHQRERRDRFA
ncbi:hypothetical protein [Burkholderia sp. Ac-20353]|uniref:hypothetical protein n=1 Tax=Burkholderia sp. Ac-20353 TaxID=2703894 RepID=UPI001F12085C|nr:hypothetical protein [Burkholderia sp. Ac-20353]